MFPLNMVITRVNSTLFPDKSKYRIGEYIYIYPINHPINKETILLVTQLYLLHILYIIIYTHCIYIINEIIISVKISHIQTPEAATLFPSSSPSWHGQVPARARGKPNVCGSCSERETIWLVVSTPLKNMKVSWDYYSYMDK